METAEFNAVVDGTMDGAVIHCEGDLTVRADAAMEAAYTEVASLGAGQITLDFARVGYINSTGIALIVRMLTTARADGRTVRVSGLTDHYRQIFEITRLSDYMTILDEAPIGATADPEGVAQ
jgi:anti-anti-sigma factor